MVSRFRMEKVKEYPQPHDVNAQFLIGFDNAGLANCTIVPFVHYDEATLPSAKKTHPENLAFSETANSNCSPESKIFNIQGTMRVSATKQLFETDKVQAMRFAFMTIHGAFEDFDADDELTSVTVGDVLELTKESTDRQTYPIYNTANMSVKYTASATVGPDMFPQADNVLENVAFVPDLYYDMLNYYTNSEKLKKVQDGLRWITLTKNNPTKLIKFSMKSNTKSMNPYAFLGVMIYVPLSGTKYQLPIATDTTDLKHLTVEVRARYLEWNHKFLFDRVDPA